MDSDSKGFSIVKNMLIGTDLLSTLWANQLLLVHPLLSLKIFWTVTAEYDLFPTNTTAKLAMRAASHVLSKGLNNALIYSY